MNLSDFNFNLPEDLIATTPATPRDHSRLLVVDRKSSQLSHCQFKDIGSFLKKNDLLVLNNTKVIPARLKGTGPKGRTFEIFLLKALDPSLKQWTCLAKPGKHIKQETSIAFPDGQLIEVKPYQDGTYTAEFPFEGEAVWSWVEKWGATPLPPYIKRPPQTSDSSRYQTVYANPEERGSVAAPTAGLHFTETLIEDLKKKGIEVAEITLTVGYGTFAPLREEDLSRGQLHGEAYCIPEEVMKKITHARSLGGRVIPVGTTSLRSLESSPRFGLTGETNLFIQPGFSFQFTDALITNFHLPQSSLFILVSAFLGKDLAQRSYAEAIPLGYRFYSYGDAMLIT